MDYLDLVKIWYKCKEKMEYFKNPESISEKQLKNASNKMVLKKVRIHFWILKSKIFQNLNRYYSL